MASRFSDMRTLGVGLCLVASIGLAQGRRPPGSGAGRGACRRAHSRAAARSGSAGRAGEQAARRAAEARARAADQGRGTGARRARAAGDSTAAERIAGRPTRCARRPSRAARHRGPARAALQARRAGYWRLLLDVDDLRSLGRAYRTAAAMTHLDRERVQAHQRTLDALAKERKALEAASVQLADAPGRGEARARGARPRRAAHESRWSTSIDARRDLNAQMDERARGRAAAAAGLADQVGTNGTAPSRCRSRLSGRPALAGPRRADQPLRPSDQQPVRHGHRPERHRDCAARRSSACRGPRGHGRVCRPVHRLRQPGHRRARRARVLALRPSEAMRSVRRANASRPGRPSGRPGRNPSGNPALYFELRVDGKPVDPLQWLQKGISMTFKTRLSVLLLSTPVLAFVLVGGLMGANTAQSSAQTDLSAPAGVRRRGRPGDEQLRRRGEGRQGHGRRAARPCRRPRSGQRVS